MTPSEARRSILIADDEPGFRDLFSYTLEPLGFEVLTAVNGAEAVKLVQARPIDLVVLDIHMPEMGGEQAMRKIQEARPGQRVIIVSSSADPSRLPEERALKSGALACLYKPIELNELIATIEQALSRAPGA